MVAVMTQPRSKGSEELKGRDVTDKSTLNVSPKARILLGKIAALRGQSMKELFDGKDLVTFFEHVYEEELRKEQQNLKGK